MLIYLRNHFLTVQFFWYVPGLLLIAFAGSFVGKMILAKINQKHFRRVVLVFIFAIGVTILWKFGRQQLGMS